MHAVFPGAMMHITRVCLEDGVQCSCTPANSTIFKNVQDAIMVVTDMSGGQCGFLLEWAFLL